MFRNHAEAPNAVARGSRAAADTADSIFGKLVCAAIVFAVALLGYARTLSFDFSYVDDDRLILQSQPALTEPGAILHAFTRPYFQQGANDHFYYRPLVTTTYVLDAVDDGQRARGYHLTNVLLHASAAALFFFWLRTRATRNGIALFGGLAFALHPGLTEAVAWIPGRPDVLMTGFTLIAWILFWRHLREPSLLTRVLHPLAWLLAILCKEAALISPAVWLLEARVLQRRSWRRLVDPLLPVGWVLVALVYFSLRAAALKATPGILGIGVGARALSNLFENASVIVSSLGKLVLPIQLSVLATPVDTWLWPGVVVLLVAVVLWQRKFVARGELMFALLAFALSMLPNLLASSKLALENRLYLPLVPVLGFVTLAIAQIDMRVERRLLLGGALVVLLAWGTLGYLDAFRDRRSFALAAVRGSPHSSLAHKNLGLVAHAIGKVDIAEREYRKALELDPSEPMAHSNLGTILGARRQLAFAEREFRAELSVNPTYAPAHHNLAALLQAMHRDDEAAVHWQASLDMNHSDAAALRALHAFYASRNDPRAAHYQDLIEEESKTTYSRAGAPRRDDRPSISTERN